MQLSLALGALTLPLFFIPILLAVWIATTSTHVGRRFAFTRQS